MKAKTRKGSADGSDVKAESADDPASASEQEAPSVQHVLQTTRAKHVVYAKEGQAVPNLTLSELLAVAQAMAMM